MPQKKVLMIAPTPFFGDRGCHVRIYEEAVALKKLGFEITICTYSLGSNIGDLDIRRIINIPWYHKLEAGPSWHKFYLDFLLYLKARAILKSEKFDLIHAHLHEGVFIAERLRKKFKIPIIADFQGSMTDEVRSHEFAKSNSLILKIFRKAEEKINRMADAMMISSLRTMEIFEKEFKIDLQKMDLVSDGVDTDAFSPNPEERIRLRREFALQDDFKVIVYLGLLTAYQGIDLLIDMIPKVVERFKKVHFLIMGFPNEKKYMRICQEKGILSYVTFTGRIPYQQAASYLSCGDIAVSPKISKTEANGKLFNYMAIGLPTVAFDTPTNREILGEEGLYARYQDSEDFCQKLMGILEDNVEMERRGKALRNKAVREYSWLERAKKISEIYQKVFNAFVRLVIVMRCLFEGIDQVFC